jgi:hypothetical protein
MATFQHPTKGDVVVVPDVLVESYEARGFERLPDTSTPELLKGAALDVALEDAGLPKTGSADEKRARLAEHTASQTE